MLGGLRRAGLSILAAVASGVPLGVAAQEAAAPADTWAAGGLEPVGVLHLEERGASVVADPRLNVDPRGGWIYWDFKLQEARLYGSDGRLERAFGRPGEGPGEFQGLVGVVRLDDGRLVALDGRGRLSVWSAGGDSLLTDVASGVPHPHGFAAAGDDEVVILSGAAAGAGGPDIPVLYGVSLSAPGPRPLFSLTAPPELATAMATIESPPPVVAGDTAFVALVPFDSLWAVPLATSWEARAMPIPSPALAGSPRPVGAAAGPRAYLAWVRAATFPGRFGMMPDGGWVAQVWGMRAGGAVRRLVRFDRTGVLAWELVGAPLLLAVEPASGRLYLWDPEGLDPASVLVFRESLATKGAG